MKERNSACSGTLKPQGGTLAADCYLWFSLRKQVVIEIRTSSKLNKMQEMTALN